MPRLSENYYLRKCFLETETVPTQSVMKKKMTESLAQVYFNSMNYKVKVLAGLEPKMKGGGSDWYIPPEEVLAGRLVMKPVENEYLKLLGFNGIAKFGDHFVKNHHKRMEEEKNKALLDSDKKWKYDVDEACRWQWDDCSKLAAHENTSKIVQAFQEFSTMYSTSITKIETVLFDAAIKEIQAMRDAAFLKMKTYYEKLLKDQATMLYDRYTKKLSDEKARLKDEFIRNVEETRMKMGNQVHDINFEKHLVVEKLRQLLETLNLACQVYVALKEREECRKEMELSQHKQKKIVKAIEEQIVMKDFEIRLAQEKEKQRQEFNKIWQKKVCAVVKKFQMFASYCFKELPEHADFFIDMEKLMLIQLSEAIEDPAVASIIEPDEPSFHTPVPRPHPFYLFCDRGFKPQLDQTLCPKHCTSSASHLPVVVVNKRFMYSACDNFEKFPDKIKEFIYGRRGEDADFEDKHIYEHDVPVAMTRSQHLAELKLQSSIMQILQEELPNVKKVPTKCCICGVPYCFCSTQSKDKVKPKISSPEPSKKLPFKSRFDVNIPRYSDRKITTRIAELKHEREPKWESYMDFVMPEECKCAKRAKKHLEEHLPAYMRNVSKYQQLNLPNYEVCPLPTLKRMVKKAQGIQDKPVPEIVESKTRDISTQYSDQTFDFLCTCFSDDELKKLLEFTKGGTGAERDQFKLMGDDVHSDLNIRASSFALKRAFSLKKLLDETPQLEEIFMRPSCSYDN